MAIMKHTFFCGLIIFTVLLQNSCNYVRNVNILTSGEIGRTNFIDTIPFKYIKGLIVVNASINEDTTERNFIFDTGAFDNKIEYQLAQKSGLKTIASRSNSTAQGISREIEITRVPSIRLGETDFLNTGAGKLTYDEYSASPCIAESGIIGSNLIKLAHWRIDYQKNQLQFSDAPLPPSNELQNHTLEFKTSFLSGIPEVSLNVENREVRGVLFDVGFNGGIVLPSEFADQFEGETVQKVIDRSTSGIYGTNTDTLTTKRLKVTIGGYETTVPIEFSSIGKALIGNDFLEHFEVHLNFNKKTISLLPHSVPEIEKGLKFIPGILNDSLWVVSRNHPNSPFSLGDTLLSINNKKPSDVFSSYCDYVMNIRSFISGDSLLIRSKHKAIHKTNIYLNK